MNWKRFRKKPVVVEAIQWNPDIMLWSDFPLKYQAGPRQSRGITGQDMNRRLVIGTLEGIMRANIGDWIVCGVKGELYPVKPDIFEMTYEEVE